MLTQVNGIWMDATTAETVVRNEKPAMKRTHRMFELVLAGYSNSAAVAKIKEEYGDSVPTKPASIAWCRNALRKNTEYAQQVLGKIDSTPFATRLTPLAGEQIN